MGLGLGGATILLDFVTRFYNWSRKGLLVVLPWVFVGQYRYLHEFVWVFSYWVTLDLANGGFSDSPKNSILSSPPAVLTHSYAVLFVLFTALAFVVLLQESGNRSELTPCHSRTLENFRSFGLAKREEAEVAGDFRDASCMNMD
jgi:hypothetical protein